MGLFPPGKRRGGADYPPGLTIPGGVVRYKGLLAQLDRAVPLPGALAGNGAPFGAGLKTADLCSNRRCRCRTYDKLARRDWGGTQLGLSLYLAARCRVNTAKFIYSGIRR